jgi:hypothetical protein
MSTQMKRGRSQVLFRYSPGSVFRYNESGGWCATREISLRDPKPLGLALKDAVAQMLDRWDAVKPTGFPDPRTNTGKYAVGEPYQVTYELFPLVFICRRCNKVHYYRDISTLQEMNDRLRCYECNVPNILRQVPYAFICECGRIDTLAIRKHEPKHKIVLVDKGNFFDSYWWCATCRMRLQAQPKEGLGFRACKCRGGKGMRGVILEDSRVHRSQTVNLVNVETKTLERWRENPNFSRYLLGAALEADCYRPSHLLDLAGRQGAAGELSDELLATKKALIAAGQTEGQADAFVRGIAATVGGDPWRPYEDGLRVHRQLSGGAASTLSAARQTVEYVFARDEPSINALALETLLEEARESGDSRSEAAFLQDQVVAESLGLVNLRVVQALPIVLAAVGYSRYFSGPTEQQGSGGADRESGKTPVSLRPFPEQDGKVPIYVARNTTEALLYELDPWRVAAFLERNCGLAIPPEAQRERSAMRAWLLGISGPLLATGESHLELRDFEKERRVEIHIPSALMFGVLHTISHVLHVTAHRFVGLSTDALAEYLFPAHCAGLLFASAQVQFTLGGIDSVFRSALSQWLVSARDFAGTCSFDPVCRQSGGACMACLYTKFGCAHFNRTLSRTFLFGGETGSASVKRVEGYWTAPIAQRAAELKAASRS